MRNSDRHGAINQIGEDIIPLIYDFMKPFSNGLSATKKGRKWGYVNIHGILQIPAIYEDAWSFINGKAQIKLGSEFGYIGLEVSY